MKRETCVVHIGMHKTGTSSIQDALFSDLEDSRFHYAALGVANQGAPIYSLFAERPDEYHGHRARGWSAADVAEYNRRNRDKLVEGFATAGTTTVEIISGEDIGYLRFSEALRFRDFLLASFQQVRIIAYIRPPISYVQSAFQELVKHGLGRFDFTHCDPVYERFAMFAEVFGKENLVIRPFVAAKLHQGDAVSDFFQVLGISSPEGFRGPKVNESLSFEALSLLYTYQKYFRSITNGPNVFYERHHLISALSGFGRTRLLFSSEVLAPLLQRNHEGITFVERLLGERLEEEMNDENANVRGEEDLLRFSAETLYVLQGLVGEAALPREPIGLTAQDVAALVEALRRKLARQPAGLPQ